jgi:hypothetical protein
MRELAIARQDAGEVALQLEIFDSVPHGFIVHAIHDDRMAPLLKAGEVAVIESNGQAGWYPVDGGLFLIEHVSPPPLTGLRYERRVRSVVQTNLRRRKDDQAHWWTCPLNHGDALAGGSILHVSDGPFDEGHLTDKLLGPVVGIYRPDCEAL